MSDFRARLFQEHTQLRERIKKYEEFVLWDDKFRSLDEIEMGDLLDQLSHMRKYEEVLQRRVSRLCNNA